MGVLVRVYGNKTETLVDRESEIRNMQVLHQNGYGSQLFAIFGNGLCYEYLPGEILTLETIQDPKMYTLVASSMADMHKKVDLGPSVARESSMWFSMRKMVTQLSGKSLSFDRRFAENNITVKRLKKEAKFLEQQMSGCTSPIVFTHNDLTLNNIIVNDGKVYFIDYEYGDYNYAECDMAYHFAEMSIVNKEVMDNLPSEQFQLDYIKCYLKKFGEV